MGVLTRPGPLGLLVLALAAPRLPAQAPDGLELGVYGGWTVPDGAFALDPGPGGGARLGWRPSGWLGLELEGGAARVGGGQRVTAWQAGLSAVATLSAGRHAPYLLAGYARVGLAGKPAFEFTDEAVQLGAGDRYSLGPHAALRLDVRGLLVSDSRLVAAERAAHLVVSVGLSWFPARSGQGDADGDGVRDAADSCPATPPGAVADERGCPTDSDRDGVVNGLDACPNTPAGALVDRGGCPLDTDRDGVYDGIDQCAATPAGAAVDGHGCPADGDADGVVDGVDRCPDTPGGVNVDAEGCPPAPVVPLVAPPIPAAAPPELFTPERATFTLQGVTFETGKSRLQPASYAVLDGVAAALRAAPEFRIEVAGYTDSTGSAGVNQRLSEARAAAVRAYLARRGVLPERMVARGYGPAHPVASNATAAGRARNRRVELRRID